MKKKKIVKLLGPVAGIMSFMLLTGVFTTSAFADQVSTSSTAITQNSTKDYKKIINKSVEQNGVKVTLLDVVATKHKIKANIKLECSKGLQDEKRMDYLFKVFIICRKAGEEDKVHQILTTIH
ncbi:DUF4179 domain-containing protein [Clostridium neonatale]|uniref:DUF4179 domain-containing protein n=1 Tax=Clostridium neonatale TaxID=137838 RepID=A0AA86JP54_9CLOT|nr:exported hypothetical protein [Clostridium neonatale]